MAKEIFPREETIERGINGIKDQDDPIERRLKTPSGKGGGMTAKKKPETARERIQNEARVKRYLMKTVEPNKVTIEMELDQSEPVTLEQCWLEIDNVSTLVYHFVKGLVEDANRGITCKRTHQ